MTRSAAATVLTVDDDPIVRADLRLVLEDAGFDVCEDARDGVEAVELARIHRPDVIVLDLALPRLDGVEATRRILDEREVPIVALTGLRHGGRWDRRARRRGRGHVRRAEAVRRSRGRGCGERRPRCAYQSDQGALPGNARRARRDARLPGGVGLGARAGVVRGGQGLGAHTLRRASQPANAKPVARGTMVSGLAGSPGWGSTLNPPGATSFGVAGWKSAANSWIWSRPTPSSN